MYIYQDAFVEYALRCANLLHMPLYRIKDAGSVQPPVSMIQTGVWWIAS